MGRCIMLMAAITAIALASSSFSSSSLFAGASDPSNVLDYCVAIPDSKADVFVNGKICKNLKEVNADDFYLQANLHLPRNTSNPLGFAAFGANVENLPGLNTLGIAIRRIDIGPYGVNPPHIHPYGAEVITVVEGTVYVGFVDSKYKLFAKTLNPGDVFVFPKGLVHFEYNLKESNAVLFSALATQNNARVIVAKSVFATDPPILPDLLSKAFQLDKDVITRLQYNHSIGKTTVTN